ncbi:MAG: putative acetolactate synthase large subunit [Rhodospirillales bacterium]|nr:putative acetolactate synthase large subunit [Rhodospirillales bacterium]
MKLSDYVADFLARQGIKHVFAITGGASIHLIHSIAAHPEIDFICPQHEQGGAMAADAYARVTGNLGAAIATSGPGATNLITGICCSWFDSVPVIYITGQVTTFRFKGETGVRQMGFQETEIVKMVEPVTKYATLVTDAKRIRYELEKAVHIAKSGRPGPVLIDIPDDLQRGPVDDPADLVGFLPDPAPPRAAADLAREIDACLPLLAAAERPVLVVGWGVRLAGAVNEIRQLADRLGFPIVPSWAAMDIFPATDPLLVGGFGTHGTRFGNFSVQNADLVLAIGARLSTRETGSPMSSWARGAKTIIVDVDPAELNKFAHFGRPLNMAIAADAKDFTAGLLARLAGFQGRDLAPWLARVRGWKARYPVCLPSYYKPVCLPSYYKEEAVNPYVFVEALSRASADGDLLFVDTGCAIAWMMQGFKFKPGQRLFHAFNNTPMGYALPAAIGGSIALGNASVICVCGDGSLLMNIQELVTAQRHRLPIKLFLINNNGYSMVQQTQEQWFDGVYHATSVEGGLGFPDFLKIAEACEFTALKLDRNDDITSVVKQALATDGPVFCDVRLPSSHRVVPQSRFGRPIEDSEPLLPRDEFIENMIVAPMEVCVS